LEYNFFCISQHAFSFSGLNHINSFYYQSDFKLQTRQDD